MGWGGGAGGRHCGNSGVGGGLSDTRSPFLVGCGWVSFGVFRSALEEIFYYLAFGGVARRTGGDSGRVGIQQPPPPPFAPLLWFSNTALSLCACACVCLKTVQTGDSNRQRASLHLCFAVHMSMRVTSEQSSLAQTIPHRPKAIFTGLHRSSTG